MYSLPEKRKAVHKWVDEVNEEELQSLWERAIIKDEGYISPEWEQELERRRDTFISREEPGLTLEALKKEIASLGRG
jgi:lipopolysaccharide biosynthesis protein